MKFDTVVIGMSAAEARPDVLRLQREGDRVESQDPERPASSIRLKPRNSFGLRSVKLDLLTERVVIEMSSKLFGRDFGRGLSDETVGLCSKVLTETGIVAPSEDALRSAQVFRADTFVDVAYGSAGTAAPLAAMASLPSRSHPVRRHSPTSLSIPGPKAEGLHLRGYDKGAELLSPKEKSFRQVIGGDVVDVYRGVMRVELQATTFKGLRRMGAVGEPRLDDLLRSPVMPISEHLRRLVEKAPAPTVVEDPYALVSDGLSLAKVERQLGRHSVLAHFRHSWEEVERFVRHATGPNAHLSLKVYRSILRGHELSGDSDVPEGGSRWVDELIARVEDQEKRDWPL